jgi:FKBP-type peptidyl-prolyl cis-trans isomerase
MIKNILNIFICFLFIFVMLSCDDKKQNKQVAHAITQKQVEDYLEQNNRDFLNYEANKINEYVESHELNVIQTGTGLRYQIHDKGDGVLIKEGDIVTLEYEISLLNGDLIYSSANDGVKTFIVGRGGVESGLEEAILKLSKNSVATLIIPVHLAYGLIGDGNKIPTRATLVYSLKVIDKQ